MARKIWYHQERYAAAAACLDELRKKVDRGWQVSQVRQTGDGAYEVAFRLELQDGHVVVVPEHETAASQDATVA